MTARLENFTNGRWAFIIEPSPNEECAPPPSQEINFITALGGSKLTARVVGATIIVEVAQEQHK